MDTNPFSIESILKKGSSGSVTEPVKKTEPSKSTEALSLAVKLAGKFLTLDRPRSLKKKISIPIVFNVSGMKTNAMTSWKDGN